MKQIGVFYGSSTGNCETVALTIKKNLKEKADLFDIALTPPEVIDNYDNIIFGVSTWGIGDLQDDWEEFLKHFKAIDFSKKVIAVYGLGDQDTYSESFADGLGILHKYLVEKNATLIGEWTENSYEFESSKAFQNGKFVGLVIDEDVQPELTDSRVKLWVKQILPHFL